jgi:phosphotransferase system  glucose/maltose/N-acetylglucosamine-specific IIC component
MPGMTRSAGTNLLLCSLALFILPLTVFFAVRHGAIDFILNRVIRGEVTTWARTVWGAILAVMTVNAVLITFVLTAFNERPEETAKKQD